MQESQGNSNSGDNLLLKALVITRPMYSYVLIAFIVAAVITIAWGMFGSIPQKIEGIGEVSTDGGLHRVNALYGGQVVNINATINDAVKKGDVIFIVRQPEMESKVKELEASVKQLKAKRGLILSGNTKNASLKKKVDNLGASRLRDKLSENQKTIDFLEKKVAQEKELYDKGLITYSQYFSTQSSLTDVKTERIGLNEQLNLITLNSEEWNLGKNITEKDIVDQVAILEKELEDLHKEYKLRTEVKAKTDGVVRQINAKEGDIISPDLILAVINEDEKTSKSYILNLYVPFSSNELIKKGMEVDIQPFNVDYNLYGWLKGTVLEVSPFVSSSKSLVNDLQNGDLVSMIESKGAVYKVIVQLNSDPNTISGFDWSNKKGPPFKIYPGQMTRAFVNVKEKAPIDYLLPIFKDYFK
ncbi:NHLP bacteriocin system secretion protein [Flavobacteriaceae bacterium S356]|uniref:NHLP bacteriocin system secretion protein n=1 Tax=Asprobacillus argus TaxID=3076534 RepID=A0ABU3LCW0_9FLAO|nr:NHLP bacteriocin system secretion protein [Flavobacteriaceae bacterium S356]